MKNRIFTYILISISTLSCKKEIVQFQPKNPFKDIVYIEQQVFDLDKISSKEIIGKKGTKVYFNREDFNINENDKITLELKEYYTFEELLSNNIRTITINNELLESSGVIYLDFKVKGQTVKLHKNKKLKIEYPKPQDYNLRIFNGKIDSLNQFNWQIDNRVQTEIQILNRDSTLKYGGVEFYVGKFTTLDSVNYYRDLNSKSFSEIEKDKVIKLRWESPSYFIEELGWINFDKFVDFDSYIDFDIDLNNKKIDNYTCYFLYENLNSFSSLYRTKEDLSFKRIPLSGNTEIIILGRDGNEILYADKINLNSVHNSILDVNLKKIDSTDIKQLLK